MKIKTTILTKKTKFDLKLTASELAFMKQLNYNHEGETVTNPYSGISCTLCPDAVALFDFILGVNRSWQQGRNIGNEELTEYFLMARDIFRANWPKEFMLLID